MARIGIILAGCAGTRLSLADATNFARALIERQGLKIHEGRYSGQRLGTGR